MAGFTFRPGVGLQDLDETAAAIAQAAPGDAQGATQNAFVAQQEAAVADEQADFFAETEADAPKPREGKRAVDNRVNAAPRYVPQKPRDVVRAAKVRIRELDALLREAKRAEKERDELLRLVSAATNRPKAGAKRRPDTENKRT
jgi:hypothetical protein